MAINPTLQQFLETLRSDAAPDPGLTDAMLELYPFFTLPAAMELKRSRETMTEERRARLSACVALNAPDSTSLMRLIDPDGDRLASLYPQEETDNTPSTDDAIATYLKIITLNPRAYEAMLYLANYYALRAESDPLARSEAISYFRMAQAEKATPFVEQALSRLEAL